MTSPQDRATSVPDVAELDVVGRRAHPASRRALLVAAVVGVATLLSSCAKDAPQDTFQPEGEGADRINDLQTPVFIVAGVVGVLVGIALIAGCQGQIAPSSAGPASPASAPSTALPSSPSVSPTIAASSEPSSETSATPTAPPTRRR